MLEPSGLKSNLNFNKVHGHDIVPDVASRSHDRRVCRENSIR